MNWDAIGAFGEVAGAIAVIASLVFLALQIRAQNKETRLAAMHEISESFRESLSQSCIPEIADILVRAGKDYDSLLDSEKLVVTGFFQRVLRVWEEAFHQFRQGRLSDNIWDTMLKQYSALISSPAAARVWNSRKQYFDPLFREFVDSVEKTPYTIDGIEPSG